MENKLVIGIDATNIRGGGGATHLIELLANLDPEKLNIKKVVLWTGASTSSLIMNKDWLVKVNPKMLNMGLFFMHKEDAEMYLQEICAQDPKGVEEYGIDIKVSGLDNYYHLNKTSPPKTQIKLVGDLKEINLLIKDYSKDKNCRKNPKQQYTHNSFKGTPVYIMHPLYGEKYTKETRKNEKIIINYGENQSVKASKSLEQLIFFNKEDADRAWKIYVEEVKKNQTDIKVNKKPHLEVYNLENYLSDLQQTTEKKITNIRFIPSSESYSYIKKLKKQTIDKPKLTFNENLVHNTKTKLKSIQRFYKGVLWLFTSDTLPSEDNSW